VLRNLFAKLVDEEISRDESYRAGLETRPPASTGLVRPGAPTSILLPDAAGVGPTVSSPGSFSTPRASDGHALVPPTPSLAIGAATPGFAPLNLTLPPTAEEETEQTDGATSSSVQPTPTAMEPQSDYFSSSNGINNNRSEGSSESHKMPDTPGATENASFSTPTSPTEEKKKSSLFGKKFPMTFPKKLSTRTSVEVKAPVVPEEKSDTASYKSSAEKEEKVVVEDNFRGVIQKIRHEYDDHLDTKPGQPVPSGVTPSPPTETPVLTPPPHTTIIIQEDNPESGGLADQYRGEIGDLGDEADTLEKIAPMWLGELLLRVCISFFVLVESLRTNTV
jgi:WD repeat-containing protein 48